MPRAAPAPTNIPPVWIYVLYMGFALALDPFRLGFALVLTSRRRPMANLFAFWLGGMTAGIGLAVCALLLLRDFTQGAVRSAMSVFDHVRSSVSIFAGGRLQITLGVLVLLGVIILRIRARARVEDRVAVGSGGLSEVVDPPRTPGSILTWFADRTHDMLKSELIWPVFVAGAASTIPPIDGVAMLAVIMASRADLGTQFSAFIVFILLMLAIVEIPLVSYLVWPGRTAVLVQQVQNWIQGHLRQIMQTLLTMAGFTFLIQGVASL
jgi:Sap, sulfolipid-1-addressing protein